MTLFGLICHVEININYLSFLPPPHEGHILCLALFCYFSSSTGPFPLSDRGLEKSIVQRINKEIDEGKENNKAGHPAKLTPWDKQSICHQISCGKPDDAVQATHYYINNAILSPVSALTVRRALKENNFWSVVKSKHRLLKQIHWQKQLEFAQYHANWTVEDWESVLWSNKIGSDGKVYTWKPRGEGISDRTTIPIVEHGGGNNLMVWGCMGWNKVGTLVEFRAGWMQSHTARFWRMHWRKALKTWTLL